MKAFFFHFLTCMNGNIYEMIPQLQKLAFKFIYSTTKLLPLWQVVLVQFKLPVSIMPKDVSMRWNLTFDDLLDFALEY